METRLAYDRVGSVRTFDEDGRLHVEATPISKANICEYLGREIPNSETIGLLPEQRYRLYRDPEELKKAADSFNRLQVLETHETVSAKDPKRDLVIGATGESAKFDAPYLTNSMVIWDDAAIERIKAGTQREISSSYAYTADMTPGEIDGESYDGRMTNIRGNHVALVVKGRAGPDVLVADSELKTEKEPEMAENDSKDDRDEDKREDEKAEDGLAEGLKSLLGENASDDLIASILALVGGKPGEDDDPTTQLDAPPPAPPLVRDPNAQDSALEPRFSKADVDRLIDEKLRANDAKHHAMDAALQDVRPLVGEVHAKDSAEAIYGYALRQIGIDPKGINLAGMKALVQTKRANLQMQAAPMAMDSGLSTFGVTPPKKL